MASTTTRPPYHPRQPSSPPLYSPAFSPASSDHTSLGFFSPRGDLDEDQQHEPQFPTNSPTPAKQDPSRSPPLSPVIITNKSFREEPIRVTKVSQVEEGSGGGKVEEGTNNYGGDQRVRDEFPVRTRKVIRKESFVVVKRVDLVLRLFGMLTCMISFSVMAADKNQGWALDSFNRYKEFRYCMWMNVMGFVYSGAQACDLLINVSTGKYSGEHNLIRYYLDFFTDQVLAYLLISASSSAATRVEDWQSNWGKDKFTQMASASVALSFLAFISLALSSLISGYNLCSHKFT